MHLPWQGAHGTLWDEISGWEQAESKCGTSRWAAPSLVVVMTSILSWTIRVVQELRA